MKRRSMDRTWGGHGALVVASHAAVLSAEWVEWVAAEDGSGAVPKLRLSSRYGVMRRRPAEGAAS